MKRSVTKWCAVLLFAVSAMAQGEGAEVRRRGLSVEGQEALARCKEMARGASGDGAAGPSRSRRPGSSTDPKIPPLTRLGKLGPLLAQKLGRSGTGPAVPASDFSEAGSGEDEDEEGEEEDEFIVRGGEASLEYACACRASGLRSPRHRAAALRRRGIDTRDLPG